MKHCINKLQSNINIQCIKIYCMCALHLFDTTNGLQKKTCNMFRIEVRNLYLTYFHYELLQKATDPQSLMHLLSLH